METDYLTPFIQGTTEMMSTMLDLSCDLVSEPDEGSGSYIAGTIGLSGEAEGSITLSFPQETAIHIVAEMLGMEVEEIDETTLQDGVGEMANIVAGAAKAKLADTEYHFLLSIPSISFEQERTADQSTTNTKIVRYLQTEFGIFELVLQLTPT